MTEKTSDKKENGKPHEKKNKKKNAMKNNVNVQNNVDSLKKKNKKNKPNNANNVQKSNHNKSKKKSASSAKRSFLWSFFTHTAIISLILGFIYIVDFEKFVRIRDGASFYVNKTISLLPPAVVTKGRETFEYIQPGIEVGMKKVSVLTTEVSTFFNTNPLVKDHWSNIREISLVCGARLVDYMRTLYLQTSQYCNDFKSKFFQ